MKLGVIDLGTNTFHVLIVKADDIGGFTELYRERQFVQLAENGIKTIGPAPFKRGVDTLTRFSSILKQNGVQKVKAFGTAALRTASNGTEFIKEVKAKTGIEIERISGGEEARLISKGVRMAVPIKENPVLIMDIGGGSVEFIIVNQAEVFWAQSFPIGVAVLYNNFHKSEPLSVQDRQALEGHLFQTLKPLKTALDKIPVKILTGASGTFDVLDDMLAEKRESPIWSIVDAAKFYPVYEKLLHANLETRLNTPGVPEKRAKLIVVALVLIKFILDITEIDTIWVSKYAMKEGILVEMLVDG
ncbi:MAG: phosphatase [Bacteroidota bacterium]